MSSFKAFKQVHNRDGWDDAGDRFNFCQRHDNFMTWRDSWQDMNRRRVQPARKNAARKMLKAKQKTWTDIWFASQTYSLSKTRDELHGHGHWLAHWRDTLRQHFSLDRSQSVNFGPVECVYKWSVSLLTLCPTAQFYTICYVCLSEKTQESNHKVNLILRIKKKRKNNMKIKMKYKYLQK